MINELREEWINSVRNYRKRYKLRKELVRNKEA